ncbi:MAG: beta-lactamase family protein [Hyphomicrobiales bacterium]|nr:beta-lactamase family protein [Hyphomicrobiales bacterium]
MMLDRRTASTMLAKAEPESAGMSSERLARLTDFLSREIEAERLPGAVAMIARRGRLVYSGAFGHRDPAIRDPMPLDALFPMYSMTKPMASVAMMMLFEEGKVQLADPLSRFFPQFANMQVSVPSLTPAARLQFQLVAAEREPTVKDILSHTAGFAYPSWTSHKLVSDTYAKFGLFKPGGSREYDVRDVAVEAQLEALSKAPLVHQPGTAWEYSYASDMVGRVVEKVAGMKLGDFLDERLFKPLGMADTGFYVPADKLGRLAKPPAKDPDTGEVLKPHDVSKRTANDSGGSGSISTAADYLRFCQMLLNGGELDGVRILSRPTVALMTSDQLGPEVKRAHDPGDNILESRGYTFGLGFAVREGAGLANTPGSPGEYTWGGAVGTYFWVDPGEALTAVLMTHVSGHKRIPYRRAMRQLTYQAIVD